MRIRHAFALTVAAFAWLGTLGAGPRPAHADASVGVVPSVVGKSRAEAVAALSAEGYLVGIYEIAGSPPDTVAAQTPDADTALPRGGIVSIDVRRATAESTPAPKAVGLTTAAAVAAFGRLYDLRFESAAGPASEKGKIVTQTPAEGQPLALRGSLTLRYVSDPSLPALVALPDVTGLTATQAVEALGAVGLHGQIVAAQVPGAPVDLVIGELPLPGSEVPRESDVRVVVTVAVEGGATPPSVSPIVPNLIGLSESAAKDALDGAGLDSTVEYVAGDVSQAFLVVEQNPAAGGTAPAGTAVMMRVVKYVAPPPSASGVAMPSLIGLTAWQAEDVLTSLGLRGYPILVDNPSVTPLHVFAQQYAVGALVPQGTSVTYRVSRPAPPSSSATVPNLFQRSVASAVAACAMAGLSLTVVEVPTNAYPAWRIFSQSRSAYTVVPAGTVVVARVAKPSGGVGSVTVPDLTGQSAAQATATLAALGLSAHMIDVFAPGKPPLKVYDQTPGAGASVAIGTLVHAKVAKLSSGWTTVPDLFGMTKAQAIAALSVAGLSGNPQDVAAPSKPIGKVFFQNSSAGTARPVGWTVTFHVAKAAVVPVPYLIGMTESAAAGALSAVGLDWKRSYKPAPPSKPAGIVFEQAILAGALVVPGTQVEFFLPGGALPPAVALVPNVVGKTKAAAILLLTGFGFVPQPVEIVGPPPYGIALNQLPAANTGATVGSVVKFNVTKSAIALVAVPNLIGLTGPQANAALAAAGLGSNGTVDLNVYKPLHKVYSQNYVQGTLVPPGTVVKWKRNP